MEAATAWSGGGESVPLVPAALAAAAAPGSAVERLQALAARQRQQQEPAPSASAGAGRRRRGAIEALKAQRAALALLSRGNLLPPALLTKLRRTASAAPRAASPYDQLDVDAPAPGVSAPSPLARPGALRAERERRLRARAEERAAELEDIPFDAPPETLVAAAIEQRALRLLELQRGVRAEVVREALTDEALERPGTLLDWGHLRFYRTNHLLGAQPFGQGVGQATRPGWAWAADANMLQRKRDTLASEDAAWEMRNHGRYKRVAAMEQLRQQQEVNARHSSAQQLLALRERQMQEQERARQHEEYARRESLMAARLTVIQQRRQFLHDVITTHAPEFRRYFAGSYKRRKQRNEGVLQFHSKKRTQATRSQRDRLLALKADDEEAYYSLVQQSKDDRVNTVLEKTNDLLIQLGSKIGKQKRAIKNLGNDEDAAYSAHSDDDDDVEGTLTEAQARSARTREGNTDLLAGKKRYNQLVHAIEERIAEQPTLLQGPDSAGKLRPYQLQGVEWMVSLYNNRLNGILADEMGLGKTIQTIALLTYLYENKENKGPHLILAPKAVLPNWKKEFAEWLPPGLMRVVIYDGKQEERKLLRDEYIADAKFNVIVTHYDLVMRDKAFLTKVKWSYIIVDEGHRLKNSESKLSELLGTQYKARQRLLLTGTPIQNNLTELWSLLNFLLPEVFSSSESFKEWFNQPFAGSRGDVELTEEEELLLINRLHQVIRPFMLRRKKAEVEKELPDKVEVLIKCDISEWQRHYYKQLLESASVGLGAGMGKGRGLQNTAVQLRKICNHPYLFLEDFTYQAEAEDEIVRASGKLELLDRILPKLKATGHRVLLFSQMTRSMDILEDYMRWRGHKFLRLDGGTKTEDRGRLLTEFNDENSDVFIFMLSTRAGGMGLNLQTADTVIMFESDWNPQMDAQAEDRAHRIGQQKEVRVIVLVSAGTIEEKIIESAREKKSIDAKVIQAGMFNNNSTAEERRTLLNEILKMGCDGLDGEIPDDAQVNRMVARTDDELDVFERMDDERARAEEEAAASGKPVRARLMTEEELPDWVKSPPADAHVGPKEFIVDSDEDDELEEVAGRKRRVRKSKSGAVYSDALTESQWLKVVDNGGDVDQASRRARERQSGKRRRGLPEEDLDAPPGATTGSGESRKRTKPRRFDDGDFEVDAKQAGKGATP